jgi:sugar transferase (PEP-CTERM/EpsH1 system associated)
VNPSTVTPGETRPLILHVLYRFDTGGLENGVVNLLNLLPAERFRHAILAIDKVVPAFAQRLRRNDVQLMALNKPPGHALKLYPRVWRLLRELKPTIVHSRNLAALEMQLVAAAAGVPVRIHSEHGRDVEDLDGSDRRLQRLRRVYSLFVHRYVTVSRDLKDYLVNRVGIDADRVEQIYNGVDTERFRPATADPDPIPGCPFSATRHCLIGTVGRMQTVKNQTLLAEAFIRALQAQPSLRDTARLLMIGDGPVRAAVLEMLGTAGLQDLAWLPGERSDVPEIMRGLHAFVLPSLAEGVSNTVLEAMATGLPVIATAVGGNAELVQHGATGEIVPSNDVQALAASLQRLAADPLRARELGSSGRSVVERRFSMKAMVAGYSALYEQEMLRRGAKR